MLKVIRKPLLKVLVFVPPPPPPCKTCKFYQAGDCTAFATQEPVSGQVMYKYAIEVRKNLRMCGPEGKFWTKKELFKMYPSLR